MAQNLMNKNNSNPHYQHMKAQKIMSKKLNNYKMIAPDGSVNFFDQAIIISNPHYQHMKGEKAQKIYKW